MAFKIVSQKGFLKGVIASMDRFNITKGAIQRSSNFLLSQRGALTVCDGTSIQATGGDSPILEIGIYVDPNTFAITPLMAAPNGAQLGIYSWNLGDPMPTPPTAPGQFVWDGGAQLWVPASQISGVTDGSDAQPGKIGEFLNWSGYVDTFMTRVNENAWDAVPYDRLTAITLPAGDWEVGLVVDMEQTGPPTTYIACYFGPDYTGPYPGAAGWPDYSQTWYYLRNVTAWDISMHFTPIRVNTAAPVNYVLDLEVVASSSQPSEMVTYPVWWTQWARRVR